MSAEKLIMETLDTLQELKAAASAVREAQRLLEVNQESDEKYIWFRLDRKYLKGYMTAWNCLDGFLSLSPNDNQEKSIANPTS